MRRLAFFLGLAALVLGTTQLALFAEPPHLDLVRGLRKEGFPDLAWEYLEKIKLKASAELMKLLPLESARTRLDLAAIESDESQRANHIAQARVEFDLFIKGNPNHPLLPTANVELARLISFQGKQHLSLAKRATAKEASAERINARTFFTDAAKRYEDAAKQLDGVLKKAEGDNSLAGKELVKILSDSKLAAELDRGINLYELGQSYTAGGNEKDVQERGKALNDAKKVFTTVAYRDVNTSQAWIARAWEAQCSHETQTDTAEKEFQAVLTQKTAVSVPGVRLAKAFRVRHAFDDLKAKNPIQLAYQRGKEWVKEYPTAKDTTEGVFVRYYLALAAQKDAESDITRDKQNIATKIGDIGLAKLKEAETLFRDLSESETEFTERATRFYMRCVLDRTDAKREKGTTESTPGDMKTFDEAYLQALVTQARLPENLNQLAMDKEEQLKSVPEAQKPEKEKQWDKKIADTEKTGYHRMIDFLSRAVQIATNKEPVKEIVAAKTLMAYNYQFLEQYDSAAVMAEHIVKTYPTAKQTPQMARLGVNCYLRSRNHLLAIDKDAENKHTPEEFAADTNRIKTLGLWLQEKYPTDPVTDSVRHDLAFLYRTEKNLPDAVKMYASIQPSYSDITRARREQGAALYALVHSGVGDHLRGQAFTEEVHKQIQQSDAVWKKTLTDLGSLAPPAINADTEVLQSFATAKIQLAQLYQLEGTQYDKIEEIGKDLGDILKKASQLSDTTKLDLVSTAESLRLNGIYGKAFVIMKAKEAEYLTKMTALLDPVMVEIQASVKTPPAEKTPGYDRMRRVQKDLVILALRASVQEAKVDRAKELLELLQQAKSETEDITSILQQLVSQIRTQIEELRTNKKVDEAKTLIDSFSQFLDTVAKQVNAQVPKNPEEEAKLNSMKLFLARGFGGIDNFPKSVELLQEILGKLPVAVTPEQKSFRLQVEFSLARNARLAGDFKRSEQVLKVLIGDPKVKGPAYSSLPIRKEHALLLEDQKNFQMAVKEWASLTRLFVGDLPGLPTEPKETDSPEVRQKLQAKRQEIMKKRETYFELFYEANRCSAKAYQNYQPKTEADTKLKDERVGKLGQTFVNLEVNLDLSAELKDKIRGTLEDYPTLLEKYKAAGGKMFLPAKEPAKVEKK